jgi:hypothetical protein
VFHPFRDLFEITDGAGATSGSHFIENRTQQQHVAFHLGSKLKFGAQESIAIAADPTLFTI